MNINTSFLPFLFGINHDGALRGFCIKVLWHVEEVNLDNAFKIPLDFEVHTLVQCWFES